MEKKVPERKVSLRDEDVIYIYDKRINRCIKEDCEGTVKYGLVLKVRVSEEESLNCFECNKCHMKYTPYPNYVRLSKTDMLTIYNQDEVTARDLKRAEDAKKQAMREKAATGNAYRKAGEKKNYEKPYGKKPYVKRDSNDSFEEKKPYVKKPYEKKTYEKKSYEKKSYDRKPYENSSFEKKPFERRVNDRKGFAKKPVEGNYIERNAVDKHGRKTSIVIAANNSQRSSYGSKRSFADRKAGYDSYRRREY